MPIHCPVTFSRLDAEAFETVDYRVMGHAFASQNELGRFCDEHAYKADMKARLIADGIDPVLTELPVTVAHEDFSKRFYLDLIAGDALYELKAETNLVSEHDKQLFNYMFLIGVQRGKLLNFRSVKVQGRIIATSLTQQDRRCLSETTDRWIELTPTCTRLRQMLWELLKDWGAFLEAGLYQEALVHFLGGPSHVQRRVSLNRGSVCLGEQRVLVHAPGVAFRLTAVTDDQRHVESHLRRFLALTQLKAIQWINLNHARIEFTTLISKAGE